MRLVIVESPTKAKTIKKFLGSGYSVLSSFGHIRDLPTSTMGVDTEHDFEPKYVIPTKAREQVKKLQAAAKKADEVILASDEDREGEAIAWHLMHALKLPKRKTKRIVFHEITKSAIEKAMKSPRQIDEHLVDAQQARRILDRLVGYELSPFLWKTVKRGLSAGRVQSVALQFIVEREKERKDFKIDKFWKIEADLKKDSAVFRAALTKIDKSPVEEKKTLKLFAGSYTVTKTTIDTEKKADTIARDLKKATHTIQDIQERDTQRTPPPPFTTSTLQQTAINTLGFSSKQTMVVAQKLYEQGFITYMRTDSVNLSNQSLKAAQKVITQEFGEQYTLKEPRFYKTRSKGAQEAHEAIRPTDPKKTPNIMRANLDGNLWKLYRLIWQRMVATQMAPASMKSTKVEIAAKSARHTYALTARGLRVTFDGYLAVYSGRARKQENELPPLATGDALSCKEVFTEEKETAAPPRYTEASLVKILEDRGIGRPSTYAPTISTLFAREYIDRDDAKRLYPQEIGTLVSDLLAKHFETVIDDEFTATMENSLDDIAEGKKAWRPVIREYYTPFHAKIEKKKKTVKKEDVLEKVGKDCPKCGKELIYRYGRFGKFVSCAGYPECDYTKKSAEDKALQRQYSGEKCPECGSAMVVKFGRFGSFLGCSKYPDCKGIKKIEKTTGVKCPECQKGDIVERSSKKGRVFYGCNSYPKCTFALWQKPTGDTCPDCGSLLVYGAKETVRCSKKGCGYVGKIKADK